MKQLKPQLVAQGFKENQVESDIERAHSLERSSLLEKPERQIACDTNSI